MKKIFFVLLVLLTLSISCAAVAMAQLPPDETYEQYELKDGAEAPEKVYARYCKAVHSGDLNTVKTLVFSKSLFLWEKTGAKMLAMTKNSIPGSPALSSKRAEKQFQYNYMIMNMTGQSPKGKPLAGEVKMIVEKGVWKVYQETWKPIGH